MALSNEEIRLRLLGIRDTQVNQINQLIQDIGSSAPPPPSPVVNTLRLADHKYVPGISDPQVWKWHDLQRNPDRFNDIQRIKQFGGEAYLYATVTTKRPSDINGFTTGLRPDQILNGWLVTGVKRFRGQEDFLVYLGNLDYQQQAANHLANEATRYGANGIYLDEVDKTPRWGYSTTPSWYTDEMFRAHWLSFITKLRATLPSSMKIYINLGDDFPISSWAAELMKLVNGVCFEFFVGRQGVNFPISTGQDWLKQMSFAQQVEHNYNLPVIAHASTNANSVANYAMLTYLLATNGLGAFSASLDYVNSSILPSFYSKAVQLGRPVEKNPRQLSATEWVRSFEKGTVYVRPTSDWGMSRIDLLP